MSKDRFVLCDDCLAAYRALRLNPASTYTLNIMPFGSLSWSDEHPDGGERLGRSGPHRTCTSSLVRLASVRTRMWRSEPIPPQSLALWEDARRVLPEWPGFHRLTLSPEQMTSLEACASELDDFMGAVAARFPKVTITSDGSGVAHFRAERTPDPTERHPLLNRIIDIAAKVIAAAVLLYLGIALLRSALG